jgi:hypothetical protein
VERGAIRGKQGKPSAGNGWNRKGKFGNGAGTKGRARRRPSEAVSVKRQERSNPREAQGGKQRARSDPQGENRARCGRPSVEHEAIRAWCER